MIFCYYLTQCGIWVSSPLYLEGLDARLYAVKGFNQREGSANQQRHGPSGCVIMGFAYRASELVDRTLSRYHSWKSRGAFARCGANTVIGRHAKLVAPHLIEIGSDVVLGEHAWLNAKDDRQSGESTLIIGNGAYIGRFAQINAWRCVHIGENVLIGDRVFISDADHNFDLPDRPIKRQGDRFVGEVILKDGCWIGIGAAILPGVTIGRNAVVAANSVVTKSVADLAVVGGIPARSIALREA